MLRRALVAALALVPLPLILPGPVWATPPPGGSVPPGGSTLSGQEPYAGLTELPNHFIFLVDDSASMLAGRRRTVVLQLLGSDLLPAAVRLAGKEHGGPGYRPGQDLASIVGFSAKRLEAGRVVSLHPDIVIDAHEPDPLLLRTAGGPELQRAAARFLSPEERKRNQFGAIGPAAADAVYKIAGLLNAARARLVAARARQGSDPPPDVFVGRTFLVMLTDAEFNTQQAAPQAEAKAIADYLRSRQRFRGKGELDWRGFQLDPDGLAESRQVQERITAEFSFLVTGETYVYLRGKELELTEQNPCFDPELDCRRAGTLLVALSELKPRPPASMALTRFAPGPIRRTVAAQGDELRQGYLARLHVQVAPEGAELAAALPAAAPAEGQLVLTVARTATLEPLEIAWQTGDGPWSRWAPAAGELSTADELLFPEWPGALEGRAEPRVLRFAIRWAYRSTWYRQAVHEAWSEHPLMPAPPAIDPYTRSPLPDREVYAPQHGVRLTPPWTDQDVAAELLRTLEHEQGIGVERARWAERQRTTGRVGIVALVALLLLWWALWPARPTAAARPAPADSDERPRIAVDFDDRQGERPVRVLAIEVEGRARSRLLRGCVGSHFFSRRYRLRGTLVEDEAALPPGLATRGRLFGFVPGRAELDEWLSGKQVIQVEVDPRQVRSYAGLPPPELRLAARLVLEQVTRFGSRTILDHPIEVLLRLEPQQARGEIRVERAADAADLRAPDAAARGVPVRYAPGARLPIATLRLASRSTEPCCRPYPFAIHVATPAAKGRGAPLPGALLFRTQDGAEIDATVRVEGALAWQEELELHLLLDCDRVGENPASMLRLPLVLHLGEQGEVAFPVLLQRSTPRTDISLGWRGSDKAHDVDHLPQEPVTLDLVRIGAGTCPGPGPGPGSGAGPGTGAGPGPGSGAGPGESEGEGEGERGRGDGQGWPAGSTPNQGRAAGRDGCTAVLGTLWLRNTCPQGTGQLVWKAEVQAPELEGVEPGRWRVVISPDHGTIRDGEAGEEPGEDEAQLALTIEADEAIFRQRLTFRARVVVRAILAKEGPGRGDVVGFTFAVRVPLEHVPARQVLALDLGTQAIAAAHAAGEPQPVELVAGGGGAEAGEPGAARAGTAPAGPPQPFLASLCNVRPGAVLEPDHADFLELPAQASTLLSKPLQVVVSLPAMLAAGTSRLALDGKLAWRQGGREQQGSPRLAPVLTGACRNLKQRHLDPWLAAHAAADVRRIVATHPCTFGPLQRKKLREAVRGAGFSRVYEDHVQLIPASDAAALFYLARKAKLPGAPDGPLETVLVYDLGAGSANLTLLEVEWEAPGGHGPPRPKRDIRILARLGSTEAGLALDEAIVRMLHAKLVRLEDSIHGFAYPRKLVGGGRWENPGERAALLVLHQRIQSFKEQLAAAPQGAPLLLFDQRERRNVVQVPQPPAAGVLEHEHLAHVAGTLSWIVSAAELERPLDGKPSPVGALLERLTEELPEDFLQLCQSLHGFDRQRLDTVLVTGRASLWPGFVERLKRKLPQCRWWPRPVDLADAGTPEAVALKQAVALGAATGCTAWPDLRLDDSRCPPGPYGIVIDRRGGPAAMGGSARPRLFKPLPPGKPTAVDLRGAASFSIVQAPPGQDPALLAKGSYHTPILPGISTHEVDPGRSGKVLVTASVDARGQLGGVEIRSPEREWVVLPEQETIQGSRCRLPWPLEPELAAED